MGLSVALNNALAGMRAGQTGLEVVSRNVGNSGTPGYHRQSVTVVDGQGVNSTYARSGVVERAFNRTLQAYYTSTTSSAGYSSTRADMLDRLQTQFGKPGDAGSLDSMFGSFQNALQALGTSPDNYATRAAVVSQAQNLASTLNSLTTGIQSLRQETETQIAGAVDTLNTSLSSLQRINKTLADSDTDAASRAALLDQRDRLVTTIAEFVDIRVDYRGNDTVALMTNSGVGLLDDKLSTFSFEPAGRLSAEKAFSADDAKNGVGTLYISTPSGTRLDVAQQNILRAGRIAGLLELRDTTLPLAQSQLDDIAAGLARAMSTVTTQGTAASSGTQQGFSLDLASIRNGNDFTLEITRNGVPSSIKIVRVDDTSNLPLDYVDANGARVIGADFSGGATSIAAALQSVLGSSFTASGSGTTLTVLDDGASGTTDVAALTSHSTATGLQNGALALSLFVDRGNTDFTDALDGAGQRLGFAGRISLNSAVLTDNKLLVQYQPSGSLGDAGRANYIFDQLSSMTFASSQTSTGDAGRIRLGGSVSDMVSQAISAVGGAAEAALGADDTQQLAMDALATRLDAEYGVNVDEEMSRLLELQNAYAANARVISAVQDLLDRLLNL